MWHVFCAQGFELCYLDHPLDLAKTLPFEVMNVFAVI